MGWAARWNTTWGCTRSNTSWRRARSRTSPITLSMVSSSPAISKRLGSVGGFREYPVTFAPASVSMRVSQEPLNPVWPVTSTDFPL